MIFTHLMIITNEFGLTLKQNPNFSYPNSQPPDDLSYHLRLLNKAEQS
jgi:hypothetical protein